MNADSPNSGASGAAHVEATLNYLTPQPRKPVYYTFPGEPPPGAPRFSGVYDSRRVVVHDMRPSSESLRLDRDGFRLLRHVSGVGNFHDDDEVQSRYYPEIDALVRRETGATQVIILTHTRRGRPSDRLGDGWLTADLRPFDRVHNDFSMDSGETMRGLLGPQAAGLSRLPFMILNVWRPIRGPLRDAPLALCRAATVRRDDVVASDMIYPGDVRSEGYETVFNPNHRWFYAPDMRPDEVLIFKTYDSVATERRARFALHTAFEDESARDVLPRESIEVRAFAFFGPEDHL